MKVLLDTHAMLWWWTAPEQLPVATLSLLSDDDTVILASAVSAYELAYKHYLGKLSLPNALLSGFELAVTSERWNPLPISTIHCLLAGQLASPHRDPFDRLLAAQSITEEAVLVTKDVAFVTFPELRTQWSR